MMTSRQSLAVKMPVCSPSCTRIDLVLCVRMASAASSKVASPGRQTGSRTQASRTVAVSSVCNSRLSPTLCQCRKLLRNTLEENAANRLLDSMSCMTTALGNGVQQRFLVCNDVLAAAALDQCPRIKRVITPEHRRDFIVVGQFAGQSLDDHIQLLHRLAGVDDGLAHTEIEDVDRLFELLTLQRRQQVKPFAPACK